MASRGLCDRFRLRCLHAEGMRVSAAGHPARFHATATPPHAARTETSPLGDSPTFTRAMAGGADGNGIDAAAAQTDTHTPIDIFAGLAEHGHNAIDIAARLVGNMRAGEVGVNVDFKPGDLAAKFPSSAPQDPVAMDKLLAQFEEDVVPGTLLWQHPKFMGYFPASSSCPAVIAEALITAVNAIGLQWVSNPVGAELEVVVMDWICEMIGGKDTPFMHRSLQGGGLIQSTAGEAIMSCMFCARVKKHRDLQPPAADDEEVYEELFYRDSSKLTVYMSADAHFCIPKAVRTTGMRTRKIAPRWCAKARNMILHVEDVRAAIEADVAQGLVPTALFLLAGSTNTCAFDPVADFADVVREHDLWLHVDAAYAGPSWILPEYQEQYAKPVLDLATSFNFNGSKWFLCGMDSAFVFVRDRKLLLQAHSATGTYLSDTYDSMYAPELKDWGLYLGRRFRALRIYWVLSYFGVKGMQTFLRNAVAQAKRLETLIASREDLFARPVASTLGLVCLQAVAADSSRTPCDARTHALAKYLREKCGFFVLPSVLNGSAFIRVALGGSNTTMAEVEELYGRMVEYCEGKGD